MNFFYLSEDFAENATYHLDSHTTKIIIETAQCISTAFVLNGNNSEGLYKPSHKGHPINLWLCESGDNLIWAAKYGMALFDEYQYRYNKPDNYKAAKAIFERVLNGDLGGYVRIGLTPFKCAVPEDCKIGSPVYNYQKYYNEYKQHLFFKKNGAHRWTKREIPQWIEI